MATQTQTITAVNTASIIEQAIQATQKKGNGKRNDANSQQTATATATASEPKEYTKLDAEYLTQQLSNAVNGALKSNLLIGQLALKALAMKAYKLLGYASNKEYLSRRVGVAESSVQNYIGLARLQEYIGYSDAQMIAVNLSVWYAIARYAKAFDADKRKDKVMALLAKIEGQSVAEQLKTISRAKTPVPQGALPNPQTNATSKADKGESANEQPATDESNPKVTTGEEYITVKFTGVSLGIVKRFCEAKGIDTDDKESIAAAVAGIMREFVAKAAN